VQLRNHWNIALVLLASSSAARAADLPTKKAPPAPPPAVLAFSWTGIYLGINGAWAGGSVAGGSLPSVSGGMLGGTVGYNYQIGQYVIGYEGDVDYLDANWLKGARTTSAGARTVVQIDEGFVTERFRLGYAWDRALVFVTAGYAGADIDAAVFDSVNGNQTKGRWANGYALGAGLEYAFTTNMSAKAEYLFTGFQSASYFTGANASKGALNLSLVRVGLNYRF
jgi:outer membrane immunogenic protein